MHKYLEKKYSINEFKKLTSVILDQGFVSLSSFLISVVLASNFEQTDYANFILLSSIVMTILGFQRAIITQPFAINFNDYIGVEKSKYLKYNVFLKIIFNICLLLIFPFYLFIIGFGNDLFASLTSLFYVITFTSYFFVKDMFISSRQTKKALLFGCSISVLIFFLLAFVKFYVKIDFQHFILTLSCIYLLSFIVFFFFEKSVIKINYSFKNNFLKDNWKVGKWIVGSNLFYSIFAQATPWIILYFLSKKDVAIYGVLISVTSLVNPVIKSFSSYLLPLFTSCRMQIDLFKRRFLYWEIIFLFMSVLLVVFGVFFGEFLVTAIFGSKYDNLGWIVFLPFINQSINVIFQPVDIALNALKRTDIGFYMLLFRLILSLVLALIFISNFGLVGVFIAKIIENILYQTILTKKVLALININHIKDIY